MPLTFSETGEFNTLEAVNLGLTYMREPRIDDLALINTSFAAEKAYANLLQVNRSQQMRGWWFNTNVGKLYPGEDGRIVVPDWINKCELDPSERHRFPNGLMLDIEIPNGGDDETRYLRNRATIFEGVDQSYVWNAPLKVVVVGLRRFMSTPDPFRRMVALLAASMSGQEVDEGIGLSDFHQRELMRAEAELMDLELSNNKVNFFSNIPQVR